MTEVSSTRRPSFVGWSPLRTPRSRLRTSGQTNKCLLVASTSPHGPSPVEVGATAQAVSVVALEDALVDQARDLAELLLTSLDDDGRRWHHTQAVAARAREAAGAVAPQQMNLLITACWLHDIGYSPAIAHTGFHPLDGALHLRGTLWPPAVVGLVAHHSGARFMARARGVEALMGAFDKPGYWTGPVADALTWADQTTGPDGERVTAHERIAEVLQRHGPDSAQARSHSERGPALLAAVEATQRRLSAPGSDDVVLGGAHALRGAVPAA